VLRASITPALPKVTIEQTPSFAAVPGQPVVIHVLASSFAPIASTRLTVNGEAVSLDATGTARIKAAAPGRLELVATATDTDGLTSTATSALRIRDPLDSAAPVAVLDSAGNRVLLHPTDVAFREQTAEEPTTIAFDGQAVGTQIVGPILDLLWLPGSAAETRDSITLLDRTGTLFSYFPNLGDIRAVRLGNSSAWLDPAAMATYLDRLYVLDRGAGQIWKYFADQNYTQAADDPAIFFSAQMGLDTAVDFDLYSEDGSLVVIYADGRVRYYDTRSGRIQWDENTLLQNGLTSPLVAPTAVKLVGRGLNASIFVLDPGSSRLVQLSRGGTLLTQYRLLDDAGNDVLSEASNFAVTDAPLRLFITAGNHIYVAER